jgi:hypothetical protein
VSECLPELSVPSVDIGNNSPSQVFLSPKSKIKHQESKSNLPSSHGSKNHFPLAGGAIFGAALVAPLPWFPEPREIPFG